MSTHERQANAVAGAVAKSATKIVAKSIVAKSVECVKVDLGDRSYPIHIGQGVLAQAYTYLQPVLNGKKIAIITDETVAELHLQTLLTALDGHGLTIKTIIIPPGEGQKSFTRLEDVLAQLLDANFSRSDTLIAFGGGVVGDLTGFVASILKRGCQFVQIPTTLLAQVDSSVGGKTAINTPAGKNLVGCFYQPKLVLADTDVLGTLSVRQLKAGYGEVLKYALIDSPDFFDWLEVNGADVLSHDPQALARAVSVCCQAKAAIVKADEFEHGCRALLNLGHSFGHALEGLAGFDGRVLHGEAVSAGMLMAFEYSQEIGLCSGQDTRRLRTHLEALGLARLEVLPEIVRADPAGLFAYMLRDKKNKDEDMALILARGIGQAFIEDAADQASVRAYVAAACGVKGDVSCEDVG